MQSSLRPHRLLLLAVALVVLGSALSAGALDAQEGAPLIAEPVVATYQGGELTLTGSGLGEPPSVRAVLFDYGARSQSVTAESPLIDVWQDDLVRLSLPADVESGQLRVFVDAVASDPVDLLVFAYDSFPIPSSPGTSDRLLAVAVGPDGTAWVNQEFHLELKSVSPDGAYQSVEIPQAEGPGIFALTLLNVDQRSRISWLGAGIAVDAGGDVWLSEGGAGYYDGPHMNSSRILRYDPDAANFECYNTPIDNAQVMGVLVDDLRGLVWYAEANSDGAAISAFSPDAAASDCSFDPYSGVPAPVCDEPQTGCHWRIPLAVPSAFPAQMAMDRDGNIWFAGFFQNAIGRLTPEAGEVLEVPLPASIAEEGPGLLVGGGPWSLEFDSDGDLWVSELLDASVLRVRTDLAEAGDCGELNEAGQNPCIDEVFVGSDGSAQQIIEWLTVDRDDRVWFAVTQYRARSEPSQPARIGFVSPGDDAVVFLPEREHVTWVTGMAAHPSEQAISFADPIERRLGQLRLLGAAGAPDESPPTDLDSDGDGCTDAQELGPDPKLGGRRDPYNFWDFFDVPNADGVRDGRIGLMGDILRVAARLGVTDSDGTASINRHSDPLSPVPADVRTYHPAFDRSRAANGTDAWDLGPPDGTINLFDVLGVVMQYGHHC